MNRPVRIRMQGGVEAEGEKPSAIRLDILLLNSQRLHSLCIYRHSRLAFF